MTERPRRAEKPKPMVGRPFEEVKELKEQHAERIMGMPNVVGVGIGMQETEKTRQFAMRVYLQDEPTPEQLEGMAKDIDGVPIVYQTVGVIKAQ